MVNKPFLFLFLSNCVQASPILLLTAAALNWNNSILCSNLTLIYSLIYYSRREGIL